jgi:hypothetical protein
MAYQEGNGLLGMIMCHSCKHIPQHHACINSASCGIHSFFHIINYVVYMPRKSSKISQEISIAKPAAGIYLNSVGWVEELLCA